MAKIVTVKLDTLEAVQQFFDQCVAFWVRQGDSRAVACCKAFWWDIIEVSNAFDTWTPAKEEFVFKYRGYRRGDPEPEASRVESGNA